MKLSQELLKERLTYDEETGVFKHRKHSKSRWTGIAGAIQANKRIYISVNGTRQLAHRLAWLYVYGYMPDKFIDHIDHNPSNNAIANLRLVDNRANARNQSKSKLNKSGKTGVSHHAISGRWQAQINTDVGKRAKYFGTKEEAIAQREEWEVELGYHANHGT